MKLIGYTRVSSVGDRELDLPRDATEEQKEERRKILRSPDQQQNAIKAYASAHGHEIIWLEPDLDWSGKSLERPSMKKALEMIRAGEADGIVAARLDRITRSVKDLDYLMVASDNEGWKLVAVDFGLDNSTANGKMIWQIFGSINEWYINRSRENFATARRDAVARGDHLGAHAPFGYVKRGKPGRLEPDPATAWIVKEIFSRRAAGHSLRAIRGWIRTTGAPMRFGGPWDSPAVTRVVKNEVYLGVIKDRASKSRKEGAHPPLVDPVTFAICQRRRGVKPLKERNEDAHLLTGLLRCAGCRYSMYGLYSTPNRGLRYYQCRRHTTSGDCPAPAFITASEAQGNRSLRAGIEEYVVDEMWKRFPDEDILMQPFGADSGVAELELALKVARDERLRWATDLELMHAISRDAFLAGAQAREEAVEQAQRAYDDAVNEHGENVSGKVRSMREEWEELSVADRRDRLSTVIQHVFVANGQHVASKRILIEKELREHPDESSKKVAARVGAPQGTVLSVKKNIESGLSQKQLRDRVRICWADEPEVDIPRQGRRGWVHPTPFLVEGDANPGQARKARR